MSPSRRFRYFKGSIAVTIVGLLLAALVGFYYQRTLAGAARTLFLVAVLGVLEISLSFDNAVVNATVLKHTSPKWRRRFLTWGMAIAVFGMRFAFPLVVVSVVVQIGPIEAMRLATFQPSEYALVLTRAHVPLQAFGGTFLGMVCLKYFFDADKRVHWIAPLEERLSWLGRFEAIEIGIMLLAIYVFSGVVPAAHSNGLLVSGIWGLITFIAVDAIGSAMEGEGGGGVDGGSVKLARSGMAGFLYLNVLDASFSFDGVIGAFALTNNLFMIAIGLGIGAMFVRSLTIMLVDEGTLDAYRYLEHGAFYAVGALAFLMLLSTMIEVPEAVTGLIGAGFIGMALWSSIRWKRLHGSTAVTPG